MTYCAQCGIQLPNEAAFCPGCGKHVAEPTAIQTPTSKASAIVSEASALPTDKPSLLKRIWGWVILAFLGLILLAGTLSIIVDAMTIAKGLGLSKSSGQGLFYWVVGFTYFFNRYYWKRNNKERANGVVTGAFSALFVVMLIYGIAMIFK